VSLRTAFKKYSVQIKASTICTLQHKKEIAT